MMLSATQQKQYIEKIRYNKYVHQFPKWPESYVIQTIIKDWSLMTEDQKKLLMHLYKDKKLITSDDQCDSNSSLSNINQLQTSQKKVLLKEQNVYDQMIVPLAIIEDKQTDLCQPKRLGQDQQLVSNQLQANIKNDIIKDIKNVQISYALDNPSPTLISQLQMSLGQSDLDQIIKPFPKMKHESMNKIKVQKDYIFKNQKQLKQLKQMIMYDKSKKEECVRLSKKVRQIEEKKQKKSTEYLKFYVFYYQRIKAKHPELTNINITRAIIHLWKQRKLHNVEQSRRIKQKKIWEKGNKTGRELFFKEKGKEGFKSNQIKMKWMRLPFEARMYWNNMKSDFDSRGQNNKKIIYRAVFQKSRKNKCNEPVWNQQLLFQQQENEEVYTDKHLQAILDELSSKQHVLDIKSHTNPFNFLDKLIPMNS